jgi:hypothetical protein
MENCRYVGAMKSGYEDRRNPERLAERGLVPEDVFCFPDIESWRNRLTPYSQMTSDRSARLGQSSVIPL